MCGYIMESKDILDSDIWRKPPLYFKVWHYLLLKAQYKDYKGLKRGQLWTSIPEIQEACSYYVGYRKVTPSKKEVWSVLDYLRKSDERVHGGNGEGGMIETTKGTHGMLVTICNFNVYQDPSYYEGNAEKNAKETAKPIRTESTGNNINKEYKEKEKESIYSRDIHDIISYLNQKAGKKYRCDTKCYVRIITARRKQFEVSDFYKVIDTKVAQWKGDPKMDKFLRPQTLFGDKFESYLNENGGDENERFERDYRQYAEATRRKAERLDGAFR